MKGSVFTIVAIALGMGTVTLPSVTQANGLVIGWFLILFGATISWYSGMLIVKTIEVTGKTKYEDMAQMAYGP